MGENGPEGVGKGRQERGRGDGKGDDPKHILTNSKSAYMHTETHHNTCGVKVINYA